MLDVQCLLGYILGILCASSFYYVFIALNSLRHVFTLCITYKFYLKPDFSLLFRCLKAGYKSVSGRS